MIVRALEDFAAALGHLNDVDFFAALGMALFGIAAVVLLRRLRGVPPLADEPRGRVAHDEAA